MFLSYRWICSLRGTGSSVWGVPPIRIEITTTISGVNFEESYSKRREDILDGVKVNLISLEHLKINKKASGRHKDLNDLENLP